MVFRVFFILSIIATFQLIFTDGSLLDIIFPRVSKPVDNPTKVPDVPKVSDVPKVPDAPNANNTLVMIIPLFRHGDRTPIELYKNDPYKNISKYWSVGLGKLTKIGYQQHYELGNWFRGRYPNFFPQNYSADKVKYISSDVDRTIKSAKANAAGLFGQYKDLVYNGDVSKVTVPVTVLDDDEDTILRPKSCPLHAELLDEYYQSDYAQTRIEGYQSTFDLATAKSGDSIQTVDAGSDLFDTLKVEKIHNLTIPAWGEQLYPSLEDIAEFDFESPTATTELKRLRGGFHIKYVYQTFVKKSKGQLNPDLTAIFNSAHDSTIVNELRALGVYDGVLPAYASSLVYELHKIDGKFVIKLFYKKTSTDTTATQLTLKCGLACSLDAFPTAYGDVIPSVDYDTACEI